MARFNLKKYSQSNYTQAPVGDMEISSPESYGASEDLPENDESLLMKSPQQDSDQTEIRETPVFKNHMQMYDKLKSFDTGAGTEDGINAWNQYFESTLKDTDVGDEFKKNLIEFFNSDDDSEDSADIANNLFEMYSKVVPPQSEPLIEEELSEDDIATASTFEVMKIAKDMASKNKSSIFNLQKTAQHKSIESANIMSGPHQTSLSPFSRDIQGGLHRIEQNKGFGIKIDDVLDIDFEAIWRGNIMDKYNSPYKDKDGNYVGGYINRRFEVNQNIPVGNNLQLSPGTRHRPWMPEYSTLESRMEVNRGNKDSLVNPFTFSPLTFNLKKKITK